MQRLVIDTNVIVAALRSVDGASNALLREVAAGTVRLLVTPALFLEYEAVLKRPEQRLVHGLDLTALDRFLAALASASEPVEISFRWRPQLPDPDDELVLEAAVNGGTDALVTHNIRDFAGVAIRFDLKIRTPGAMLKEMRQ